MTTPLNLLMIEDSEDDALLIVRAIQQGGYDVRFERVDTPEALQEALTEKSWDLVLADYTMPHFSGTEALKLLKEIGLDLPFIIVSGTIGEETAVSAMKAGAHDFINKGQLPRLLPAVQRELREAKVREARRRAEDALRLSEERYRILYEWERKTRVVIQRLRKSLNVNEIFSVLVREVGKTLRVDRCFVVQFEGRTVFPIQFEYLHSPDMRSYLSTYPPWGDCPLLKQCATGEQVFIEDVNKPEVAEFLGENWRESFKQDEIAAFVGIPIIYHEQLLSILVLHSKEPRAWSDQAIHFLQTIAEQVAVNLYQGQVVEELEKTTQLKTSFLANMSHEVRTPLNAIIGFSEMLQSENYGPLTPKQSQYIDNVVKSGHHLLKLVNGILDLSKVESGNMPLQPETFDPSEVLREAASIIEGIAERKNVKVRVEIDPDLGYIEADPEKFKHVLYNLLSNAVKFNREGGLVFARLFKSEDGEWLTCEIEDTGVGISEKDLSKLFTPFYQVDSGYTRRQEGTGLGLALTHRLIKLQGGDISVRSVEGQGAVFAFTLPLKPPGQILEGVRDGAAAPEPINQQTCKHYSVF